MKRYVLIALVLVMGVVFAFTALQSPLVGVACADVGWNSRPCWLDESATASQHFAFTAGPDRFEPMVGWNS